MCTADWESQRINVSSYHNSFNPRAISCVPKKETNEEAIHKSLHRDSSQEPQKWIKHNLDRIFLNPDVSPKTYSQYFVSDHRRPMWWPQLI